MTYTLSKSTRFKEQLELKWPCRTQCWQVWLGHKVGIQAHSPLRLNKQIMASDHTTTLWTNHFRTNIQSHRSCPKRSAHVRGDSLLSLHRIYELPNPRSHMHSTQRNKHLSRVTNFMDSKVDNKELEERKTKVQWRNHNISSDVPLYIHTHTQVKRM